MKFFVSVAEGQNKLQIIKNLRKYYVQIAYNSKKVVARVHPDLSLTFLQRMIFATPLAGLMIVLLHQSDLFRGHQIVSHSTTCSPVYKLLTIEFAFVIWTSSVKHFQEDLYRFWLDNRRTQLILNCLLNLLVIVCRALTHHIRRRRLTRLPHHIEIQTLW